MKILSLALLILVFATISNAQPSEIVLDSAFSQLKGNGAAAFAKTLYDTDQENARQLVSQLNPLMNQAGDFFGYEILSRRFLTKRVERIVIAVYFEHFPVYMRIDAYDTPKGRLFLTASCNKEAAALLPFDLISASGK